MRRGLLGSGRKRIDADVNAFWRRDMAFVTSEVQERALGSPFRRMVSGDMSELYLFKDLL